MNAAGRRDGAGASTGQSGAGGVTGADEGEAVASPSAKSGSGGLRQGDSAGVSTREGSHPAFEAAFKDRCASTAGCSSASAASSNFHAPKDQPKLPLRS